MCSQYINCYSLITNIQNHIGNFITKPVTFYVYIIYWYITLIKYQRTVLEIIILHEYYFYFDWTLFLRTFRWNSDSTFTYTSPFVLLTFWVPEQKRSRLIFWPFEFEVGSPVKQFYSLFFFFLTVYLSKDITTYQNLDFDKKSFLELWQIL